jgi:pyroglutamyl-peptidase
MTKIITLLRKTGELCRLTIFGLLLICATGCADDDGGRLILIETIDLPDGRVAMLYSTVLEASDVSGPITWSVTAGNLPPGLDLSPLDGAITGEPSKSGSYGFTVQAQDDDGTDDVDLQITIPTLVLMSGFGPFGTYDTNPSYEALLPLHEQLISSLDIRIIEIPVTWESGWPSLLDEIDELNPDVVVGTGVAGSDAMRFETLARNVASGKDEDDVTLSGEPVVEGGPATIPTELPVSQMSDAMDDSGFDIMISDNAGDFLCNYVFYNLMYHVNNSDDPPVAAGFIHVPPASDSGTFSVEDITAAHVLGLEALSTWLDSSQDTGDAVVDTHTAPIYF